MGKGLDFAEGCSWDAGVCFIGVTLLSSCCCEIVRPMEAILNLKSEKVDGILDFLQQGGPEMVSFDSLFPSMKTVYGLELGPPSARDLQLYRQVLVQPISPA